MPDFPAHASPAFTPIESPRLRNRDRSVSALKLNKESNHDVPPPLVSPAFTPPRTPPVDGQRHDRQPTSVPVLPESEVAGGEGKHGSRFLEELPEVRCEVRARIPTTTGTEMWLHLYHNNVDDKEHL